MGYNRLQAAFSTLRLTAVCLFAVCLTVTVNTAINSILMINTIVGAGALSKKKLKWHALKCFPLPYSLAQDGGRFAFKSAVNLLRSANPDHLDSSYMDRDAFKFVIFRRQERESFIQENRVSLVCTPPPLPQPQRSLHVDVSRKLASPSSS